MIESRIRHLEQQHQSLDKQIDIMEKTGKFDDIDLQYLKRKRLQIRDELDDLEKKKALRHE